MEVGVWVTAWKYSVPLLGFLLSVGEFLLSSQGRQDSFPEPPLCFDLPPGKRHPERSWGFSPGSASNCPQNREIATHPSQKLQEEKRDPAPSWVNETEQVAKKKRTLVTEGVLFGSRGRPPWTRLSILAVKGTAWPGLALTSPES